MMMDGDRLLLGLVDKYPRLKSMVNAGVLNKVRDLGALPHRLDFEGAVYETIQVLVRRELPRYDGHIRGNTELMEWSRNDIARGGDGMVDITCAKDNENMAALMAEINLFLDDFYGA